MTEAELLADCLKRLNSLGLPYMLTGSMASNYWGMPRTTHDVDFVLAFQPSQASAIVAAFQPDYALEEPAIREALDPPFQFNAIDLRSALKVDFWALRPDAFAQEVFSRRLRIELLGETAWIGTAEDTLLNKLVWNRISPSDRQVGDAAGIVAVQGDGLDRPYLERWGRILGVESTLGDLLEGRIRPKNT